MRMDLELKLNPGYYDEVKWDFHLRASGYEHVNLFLLPQLLL
jgi:hypothetical protein